MADFGIVFDERFRQHRTGPGHPERPERLDAIGAGLRSTGLLNRAVRIEPTPVDAALLHRLHTAEYIARLQAACRGGAPFIDDPDSAICPESWEIAQLAAGSVVEGARQIAAGRLRRAFCAVRPPGHHAEADRSMGFCLLNNVALAARVLLDDFDFERVAILDWDVHHGNGTQHLFEHEPRVLFVSIHGDPHSLYPGTGFAHERGRDAGASYTLNVPMPPGSDDAAYRGAFERAVGPALHTFAPEVVLISAGFDAHCDDPLGNQALSDQGFADMTRATLDVAEAHAGGRILSVLEGGYDLGVLERCVARHAVLLGAA